jgi:poly(A) polymerase
LSVKLALDIEDSTYKPIKKYKYLLKNENIGRRYEEMLKILLSGYSSLCISRLKQIALPKEVFPLFDDIYFKKKPDLIALEVLKKTDDRICNDEGMVSVSFLFASILWHMIYPKWQKKLNKDYSSLEALEMAVEEQKKQFFSYGIIRNVFSAVTYIWRTQIFFENPNLDNLHNFVNSSRFRQGLHLFNLRHLDNQIDPKLYQWWNQYVEANMQEKTRLEDELKILCNITHR